MYPLGYVTLKQGLRDSRAGARGGPGPPINKLTLLKTAAFVLNFKLWPPKLTALPSALRDSLSN